jgi:hypothetical protein
MANTIATQTLVDGNRNLVVKINITGDASGDETVALVIDASTYAAMTSTSEVKINVISSNLGSFDAQLNWDATTDVMAWALTSGSSVMDFRPFGGLKNNSGAGKTGDILLSTTGLGAEKGTILIEMEKVY